MNGKWLLFGTCRERVPGLRRSERSGTTVRSMWLCPPSMCYTLFIHPRANASTTKRSRYETGVCSSELPRLDLRASHERSRCADLARCRRKQPPRLVVSRW